MAQAGGAACLLPSDGSGRGMNIVLLAEVTVEQVIGGAERVLRQQALGLAKLGHHVRVCSGRPDDRDRDRTAVCRDANQRTGLCSVFGTELSSRI